MKKHIILGFTLVLSILSFTSCGSSGGGSESSSSTTGVLVDPFIEGAVLCEDSDQSGTCDSGEQLSSATDANGEFSFSSALTPDSHIIMKEQGFHNDVPYTLKLAGVVDSEGKIDVVSPLTTLRTKELSASQIRGLLEDAGLDGLSDDDIFANPLEGGINSLESDDELRRLHASLATYGMLKVMNGSKRLSELSSTEFLNSSEVDTILTTMVSTITDALSRENLDEFQNTADGFNQSGFTAPQVSVNVVAKTAVTAIDAITKAAYNACNQTDGTDAQKVAAAIAKVNEIKNTVMAKVSDIGMQYYAKENKSTFNAVPAQYQSLFPAQIQAGLAMDEDEALVIADNLSVSTQGNDVANFIMQAYADAQTQAVATQYTECGGVHEDDSIYAVGLDCDGDNGTVAFATPRGFKVAFKSMGLINTDDEKIYLFNKESLEDSIVFDLTDPKDLGEMTVPQGSYKSAFAEIYYYWLDMEMYNEGEYTQFRVYMSDDNTSHATAGHHQGDITLTDVNNSEIGWIAPGAEWTSANVGARVDGQLYAATADPDTGRHRGPFGTNELWNNDALNPDDIFTPVQSISLNIEKESKIKLTFKVKNNWYFEDYNGDGIFGPALHKDNDNNITEAADANATWAPLLELPTITKLY
jgi:hypothetical protein